MKKYLAITAALALALTACGQAAAAPAEQPQSIGSDALRLLTAAADGVYYQVFNDWEINYTDTMGRALIYAIDEQTGDARPVCSLPGCAHDSAACPAVPMTAQPAPRGAMETPPSVTAMGTKSIC